MGNMMGKNRQNGISLLENEKFSTQVGMATDKKKKIKFPPRSVTKKWSTGHEYKKVLKS